MKDLFEPEDFHEIYRDGLELRPSVMANIANAKYREWLAKGTVVYGKNDGTWMPLNHTFYGDTHQAILVNIQEIEKCEHLPYIEYHKKSIGVYPEFATCEKCNKKLKPTGWTEVKDD